MTQAPKIIPREDGPFVVEHPPEITGPDGAPVETKGVAALCRCGQSKTKPFCDGSHNAAGYTSAPEPEKLRNTPLTYSGSADGVAVSISYTPAVCTHAAECVRLAGAAFMPSETPWVQPDKGHPADLMDAVAACPSGALRVTVGEAEPHHLTTGDVSIHIAKDGPYYVTNVALEAEFNGVGASRTKYALCRCGLSKNKPFCDGSHYDEKWTDD
ncbi:MAG: CDGSH iron-sulfur domain-containing protein [Pseudomonadota bacterium]